FDASSWDAVVADARAAILTQTPVAIVGSDRDAGAIDAARANAARAGVGDDIRFERRALTDAPIPERTGALVTNPPYGVRVGRSNALRDLYAALGNLARRRLGGWHVALLCADRRLCAQTRLPLQSALPTRNGGLTVELLHATVPEAGESSGTSAACATTAESAGDPRNRGVANAANRLPTQVTGATVTPQAPRGRTQAIRTREAEHGPIA